MTLQQQKWRRNSHFIAVFSWEQTRTQKSLNRDESVIKFSDFPRILFSFVLQCVLSLCWRLFAKEMLRSINWRVCFSSLLNNKRNLWFFAVLKEEIFWHEILLPIFQSSRTLIKFLSINLTMKKCMHVCGVK